MKSNDSALSQNNCDFDKGHNLFIFREIPILAGITTVDFGDFSQKADNYQRPQIIAELKMALQADTAIALRHTHNLQIKLIDNFSYREDYDADALILLRSGYSKFNPVIYSATAGSPVVILTDAAQTAIALIYCGWREIYGRLLHAAVVRFCSAAGIDKKSEIIAWIWPGTCKQCFRVWPDSDIKRFMNTDFPHEKGRIDLRRMIVDQLLDANLELPNIRSSSLCAYHSRYGEGFYFFNAYGRTKKTDKNAVFAKFKD